MKTKIIWLLSVACALCLFVACGTAVGGTKTEADGLHLSESSVSLDIGESFILSAETEKLEDPTFVADNTQIVQVTSFGKKANITALSDGVARITVTLGTESTVCTVTVNEDEGKQVGLSIYMKSSLDMVLGITTPVQMQAELLWNGSPVDGEISFSVEDSEIAEVTESGLVTPIKEGATVLFAEAEYQGETSDETCILTVLPNADLVLESSEYLLFMEGENTPPPFTLYFNDEIVSDTSEVTVVSQDESIVVVNESGALVPQKPGKAKVAYEWKGLKAELDVSVYQEEILVDSIDDFSNISQNNYYRLVQDLNYTFDSADKAFSDYVIEELNTTIDGDGHRINLVASGGMSDPNKTHMPNMNFVKTIGTNGLIKNVRFSYTLTSTSNVSDGTMLIGENNGTLQDLEVNFIYHTHYVNENSQITYLTGGGKGLNKNLIIRITSDSWQPVQAQYSKLFLVSGGGTFENVLIVASQAAITIPEGSNVVHIKTEEENLTSGFSTINFNIDETNSFWTLDDNGIPTFNSDIVFVESLEDITSNLTTGSDFKLMTDLTINFDGSNRNANIIDTLTTKFDGNGHTITITATSSGDNQNQIMNFIREIGPTGVVKNLKINYTLTSGVNTNIEFLIFRINNGLIENVEAHITNNVFYCNNYSALFVGQGSGTMRNVVAYVDGSGWQFSEGGSSGVFKFAAGEGTFENILVLTKKALAMPTGTNIVKVSEDDFTSDSFDTASFNIDGINSVWTVSESGVPVFKNQN